MLKNVRRSPFPYIHCGVSLEENKRDEPMQIDQSAGSSTCIAESSTHLALRLHTRVRPVLFLAVILENMPASLVGIDLLRALGIDPHEMLTTKVSEGLISLELDVSGIPSISSKSGMSVAFDQGPDLHTILTKGGYSRTLGKSSDNGSNDWIKTDRNPPGDELQDVLEGIIDRGGKVLDTEQKDELRNLVNEFVDVWKVDLSLEMDQLK